MSEDMTPYSGEGSDDDLDPELTDRLNEALFVDAGRRPPSDTVDRIRAAAMMKQQHSANASDRVDEVAVDPSVRSESGSIGQRVWSKRRVLLAAAAVTMAGLTIVGLALISSDEQTPVEEALADGVLEYRGELRGEPGVAQIEVVRTGVGRVISIATDQLVILPKSEFYEVWFVGPPSADGAAPPRISVGTFHPDENGVSNVILTGAVDPTVLPLVEITAEPGDGDPRPGGPVVMSVTIGPS